MEEVQASDANRFYTLTSYKAVRIREIPRLQHCERFVTFFVNDLLDPTLTLFIHRILYLVPLPQYYTTTTPALHPTPQPHYHYYSTTPGAVQLHLTPCLNDKFERHIPGKRRVMK